MHNLRLFWLHSKTRDTSFAFRCYSTWCCSCVGLAIILHDHRRWSQQSFCCAIADRWAAAGCDFLYRWRIIASAIWQHHCVRSVLRRNMWGVVPQTPFVRGGTLGLLRSVHYSFAVCNSVQLLYHCHSIWCGSPLLGLCLLIPRPCKYREVVMFGACRNQKQCASSLELVRPECDVDITENAWQLLHMQLPSSFMSFKIPDTCRPSETVPVEMKGKMSQVLASSIQHSSIFDLWKTHCIHEIAISFCVGILYSGWGRRHFGTFWNIWERTPGVGVEKQERDPLSPKSWLGRWTWPRYHQEFQIQAYTAQMVDKSPEVM